ncbi:MAG: hypothetical protein U1E15_12735 [Hyphomicrobiales bacterium]
MVVEVTRFLKRFNSAILCCIAIFERHSPETESLKICKSFTSLPYPEKMVWNCHGSEEMLAGLAMSASGCSQPVRPTPRTLSVCYWWTSGGEAAAVAEFAKAGCERCDHWVDGAIAGSGDVARPIIISRILGGNPMGATQLNPARTPMT